MKTISNLLTVFAAVFAFDAIGQNVHAQGPGEGQPEVGFIRIINAVAPGQGAASILIDGDDIFAKGYALGQKTGGLGLKVGAHTITIKKEGLDPGTTKLDLAKGETVTLIGFGEKVPAKKEGDPPKWEIKVLRLKQSDPEKGFRLAVISLFPKDELALTAQIVGRKPEPIFAKRLVVATMNLGKSKPEVILKFGEEVLTTIAPEDPGNYVVVLYEDESGKVKALSFYDPKFVIAG